MKKLFAVLLVLLPMSVVAGGVSLTWTLPTQNTDGTAIPATGPLSLSSIKAEYVTCTSAATAVWPATPTSQSFPGTATAGQVTGLTDGARYCFRLYAINAAGTSADATVVGTGVASVTKPNPVTNLQVATLVAYYVVQQADKFVLLAAGEVAPDTRCNATQSVNGKYGVPTSAVVKWYGTVRPLVLVADCNPA